MSVKLDMKPKAKGRASKVYANTSIDIEMNEREKQSSSQWQTRGVSEIERPVESIEEAYSIANSEHTIGTNQYTFKFNHQWRTKQQLLKMGIRKIHLHFSPRFFQVIGLSISNGININNVSSGIMITGSMTEANRAFRDDVKLHEEYYTTMPKHIYNIYYDPSAKEIVYEITTTDPYYFVIDADVRVITGKNSFNDGELVYDSNNRLRQILFSNVWDRENVYVQASFVDLAYGNYLGVTNDSYCPPKIYPIVFGDQKFWIKLYDSLGNEIELPNDGKDNLIIESIMIA